MKSVQVRKKKGPAKKPSPPNSDKKPLSVNHQLILRYCIPLVFFSFFFFFLLYYINPAIIHWSSGLNIHSYVTIVQTPDTPLTGISYQNLFILDLTWQYLRETATISGGWIRFAVTILIYACHYPILGAAAFTGLTLFFCWIFALYIQGLCGKRPFFLQFVPAFFILTFCSWYEAGYIVFLLPVAGTLSFAVLYRRLRVAFPFYSSKPSGLNQFLRTFLLQSLLFWTAWYLTQWGCLLFLLFIIINEAFDGKNRIIPTAISTICNLVLFYLMETRFLHPDMVTRWNDFTVQSGLPFFMVVFFPVAAIITLLLNLMRVAKKKPAEDNKNIIYLKYLLFTFSVVVFTAWLCGNRINRDTRTVARTAYHVLNDQWKAVLNEKATHVFRDFPQKTSGLHIFMIHARNRALCGTGQLGDKLFKFPQAMTSNDPLLMMQNMTCYLNWIMVQDLAMDLGLVNTAEKFAGEIMENMGPYPDIIYRRALLHIAQGNRNAASIYLRRLLSAPFYRKKAGILLKQIDNKEIYSLEPQLATMLTYKDTIDYYISNTISADLILRCLLESNHRNKSAYDYLMTHCLLNGKLDQLADLARFAHKFGYNSLPRYWEEGLFLYQTMKMKQNPSEFSFSGVHQETVNRFLQFNQAIKQLTAHPEAASRLAPSFANSYFFFYTFGYSPGTLP